MPRSPILIEKKAGRSASVSRPTVKSAMRLTLNGSGVGISSAIGRASAAVVSAAPMPNRKDRLAMSAMTNLRDLAPQGEVGGEGGLAGKLFKKIRNTKSKAVITDEPLPFRLHRPVTLAALTAADQPSE